MKGAFSIDEVLGETHWNPRPIRGVYFLVRDGVIVYVGQSIHCMNRIFVHLTGPKDFDSYAVFPLPETSNLNDAEAENILNHRPEYNTTIPQTSAFVEWRRLDGRRFKRARVESAVQERFLRAYPCGRFTYFRVADLEHLKRRGLL